MEFQKDPKDILQAAIQELEVFTQPEASRIEVGKDGRLIAAKESHLERIIGLARCYIGPLFSDQVRQEQEKKLGEIKQVLLQARDVIQSHHALIKRFEEGDDFQRKWHADALSVIQRFNAILEAGDSSKDIRYNVYNFERRRLLRDHEIKSQRIELPHSISIKDESLRNSHSLPAQKVLKVLSQTLLIEAAKKSKSPISSTHIKTVQFMVDTFHMKAIRTMQSHLSEQYTMAEIIQLVKQTSIEIEEEDSQNFQTMRQIIEVGPGFFFLLTGNFKRKISDPKFMTMPILDSFKVNFQLTHSGFPYPSQHIGWSLSDNWIDALPLRTDQVPRYHQVDLRKKILNQKLLFDPIFIKKARQHVKIKKQVFDQNKELFLPLHCQLQQLILQSLSMETKTNSILETFYQDVAQANSPFNLLTQTQQHILDLFNQQPLKALEDDWLNAMSPLRTGSPQKRFHSACQKFESYRLKAKEYLDPTNCRHAYILQQGDILGKAFQSIALQYQSEKMGFSPPLLNDFERKLQACAFEQLMTFLNAGESEFEILDPNQIKENLLNAWNKEIQIFSSSSIEDSKSSAIAIIDELEVYFNSRFSAHHPRHSEDRVLFSLGSIPK